MNTDWNIMDMTLLETQNALLAAQLEKIKTNLRRAQRKYVASNRDKINAIQKQYYYRHKDDPAYKIRKKEQNWVYREKQKLQKIAKEQELI